MDRAFEGAVGGGGAGESTAKYRSFAVEGREAGPSGHRSHAARTKNAPNPPLARREGAYRSPPDKGRPLFCFGFLAGFGFLC